MAHTDAKQPGAAETSNQVTNAAELLAQAWICHALILRADTHVDTEKGTVDLEEIAGHAKLLVGYLRG